MNSRKDKERLLKRVTKLVDEAWTEMNEISGLDPKQPQRRFVWERMKDLQQSLSDGVF